MTILSKLDSMQTLIGRQQLVELVAEQADLKADFEVTYKLFNFTLCGKEPQNMLFSMYDV